MRSVSSLEKLPLNIIFQILTYLSIEDLQSVAQTCRTLQVLCNESIAYNKYMQEPKYSNQWVRKLIHRLLVFYHKDKEVLLCSAVKQEVGHETLRYFQSFMQLGSLDLISMLYSRHSTRPEDFRPKKGSVGSSSALQEQIIHNPLHGLEFGNGSFQHSFEYFDNYDLKDYDASVIDLTDDDPGNEMSVECEADIHDEMDKLNVCELESEKETRIFLEQNFYKPSYPKEFQDIEPIVSLQTSNCKDELALEYSTEFETEEYSDNLGTKILDSHDMELEQKSFKDLSTEHHYQGFSRISSQNSQSFSLVSLHSDKSNPPARPQSPPYNFSPRSSNGDCACSIFSDTPKLSELSNHGPWSLDCEFDFMLDTNLNEPRTSVKQELHTMKVREKAVMFEMLMNQDAKPFAHTKSLGRTILDPAKSTRHLYLKELDHKDLPVRPDNKFSGLKTHFLHDTWAAPTFSNQLPPNEDVTQRLTYKKKRLKAFVTKDNRICYEPI